MRIAFFGDSLTSGVLGGSHVAVLRERFPDDTLLKFGKGNDTVVSLYRRISAMQFDGPLDTAFLWIGVNDVRQTDRWAYRAFHTLLMQRRTRDRNEFEACFRVHSIPCVPKQPRSGPDRMYLLVHDIFRDLCDNWSVLNRSVCGLGRLLWPVHNMGPETSP